MKEGTSWVDQSAGENQCEVQSKGSGVDLGLEEG